MASQVRASSQEEIYEYSGDGSLKEEKSNEQLLAYREGLRAKLESDRDGTINSAGIPPSEAFEVFNGKVFLSRSEYSHADLIERRVESPIQRFTRLRAELEELRGDLDAMAQDDKPSDSTVWTALQTEAKKLSDSASSLEGHTGFQVYGKLTAGAAARLTFAVEKAREITTTTTSSASAVVKESGIDGSSGSSNAIVSTAPAGVVTLTAADVVAFERRVAALEVFLGSAANTLEVEAASSSQSGSSGIPGSSSGSIFPLIDTVAKLEKRMSLLDTHTLDALRSKATALKVELEVAGKAKASITETRAIDAARKVDDLHEKIGKVQAVASDLPALVLRLKTLESIHQNAASFASRLQGVEQVTQGVADDLKNNSEVLHTLKQGLADNLAAISENVLNVDKRINALSSK